MDATTDLTPNFEIFRLPSEILMGIFEHLPARDRKIVRLVCRQFYDACNVAIAVHSEKLFFSHLCSTENMLTELMTYKQKFRNIEFVRKKFKTSSIRFWKKHGPNLCNLRFISCKMDQEIIKEVIEHCSGLLYLCWKGSEELPFNYKTLTFLVKNNVTRKSLRRLEINVSKSWINLPVLSCIFTIFPTISTLTINCHYEDPITLFSRINEIRTLRLDIFQKLELKMINGFDLDHLSSDVMMQIISSAKIREFSGSPDSVFCMFSKVCASAPNALYLEYGHFRALYSDTKSFFTFMSNILDACPRLRYLELHGKGKGQINMETFKKLLTSSLESLVLRFRPPLINPNYVHDDVRALPFNDTVRALCIRKTSKRKYDLKLILEKFRNLKHLALYCVSDEIIQFLCQHQTNLRSLELHLGKFCTNQGFIQHSSNLSFYPLSRLTKLECLYISLGDDCWVTYDFFNTLRFPYLRYLELNFNSSDDNFIPILGFIKHLSILETLSISNLNVPCRDWISLCSDYLKRLRFLYIDSRQKCDIDSDCVRELFHRCRSVRVFKYSVGRILSVCFFYNTFTGKLDTTPIDIELTSEMFSPFRGHWAGTESPEMNFIEDSDYDSYSDAVESDSSSCDDDSDSSDIDVYFYSDSD